MFLALQTNQKKLVDSIASGSVKKIEKLLEAGLDPNFTTDDKSEEMCIIIANPINMHADSRR